MRAPATIWGVPSPISITRGSTRSSKIMRSAGKGAPRVPALPRVSGAQAGAVTRSGFRFELQRSLALVAALRAKPLWEVEREGRGRLKLDHVQAGNQLKVADRKS